jgi:hypothetical protein
MMRKHWGKIAAGAVALALVAAAVLGFAVMGLWNWLVPSIFGGKAIGFWQALGLLVLARILVGGFRGGPGRHGRWRHRMMERWEQMTPEERERFREGLRSRCGHGHHDERPAATPPVEPTVQP